jgi:phosphohistidine phosphatase SixA
MKLYLVHHTDALSKEQDPGRHLSQLGREQADRLGTRLRQIGVAPVRILHSDKQWTLETAGRIAARLGAEDRTALAGYPINTDDPLEPFLKEIEGAGGDLMMCGHVHYLRRAASKLVCGDENRRVVEFKPGNGAAVCLDDSDGGWAITFAWRQDHPAG